MPYAGKQRPLTVPHTTLNYWLWEVIKADKADVEIVEMGIDATQRAIVDLARSRAAPSASPR